MIKIIKRGHTEEHKDYERFFERTSCPGSGFAFPSDENGVVNVSALPQAAQVNYHKCLNESGDFIDTGVRVYQYSYRVPSVGLCGCGAEVYLSHFTNTCDCGKDYNWAGQELAPRSQWGEETGEHWTECY